MTINKCHLLLLIIFLMHGPASIAGEDAIMDSCLFHFLKAERVYLYRDGGKLKQLYGNPSKMYMKLAKAMSGGNGDKLVIMYEIKNNFSGIVLDRKSYSYRIIDNRINVTDHHFSLKDKKYVKSLDYLKKHL